MSHIYRCSCCRTRNTFPRPLADYIRPRRCRSCRHTRFYVDRERVTRKACRCSGYHYAHRPGSRCCEHNPQHACWRAAREGADDDTLVDLLWESKGKTYKRADYVPF